MDQFAKVILVAKSCKTPEQIEAGRTYLRLVYRSGIINNETLDSLQKLLNFKARINNHDAHYNFTECGRSRTLHHDTTSGSWHVMDRNSPPNVPQADQSGTIQDD